jgi:hypothetical protein
LISAGCSRYSFIRKKWYESPMRQFRNQAVGECYQPVGREASLETIQEISGYLN